jgi:hypothetical protein
MLVYQWVPSGKHTKLAIENMAQSIYSGFTQLENGGSLS